MWGIALIAATSTVGSAPSVLYTLRPGLFHICCLFVRTLKYVLTTHSRHQQDCWLSLQKSFSLLQLRENDELFPKFQLVTACFFSVLQNKIYYKCSKDVHIIFTNFTLQLQTVVNRNSAAHISDHCFAHSNAYISILILSKGQEQGRTQWGAAGLQPPQTPQNRNVKTQILYMLWYQKFYVFIPQPKSATEIGWWLVR